MRILIHLYDLFDQNDHGVKSHKFVYLLNGYPLKFKPFSLYYKRHMDATKLRK